MENEKHLIISVNNTSYFKPHMNVNTDCECYTKNVKDREEKDFNPETDIDPYWFQCDCGCNSYGGSCRNCGRILYMG